jgi:hypothetical protein
VNARPVAMTVAAASCSATMTSGSVVSCTTTWRISSTRTPAPAHAAPKPARISSRPW